MSVYLLRNPHSTAPEVASHPPFRSTYRRTRRSIVKDTVNLCRGALNDVYVRLALRKSDYLLVAVDEGKTVGFAVLSFFGPRTLRVNVLCSSMPGIGSKLMRAVDKFAAKAGVEKLVLKALPSAATFYERMGFGLNLNAGLPNTNVEEDFENVEGDPYSGIGPTPMSKSVKKRTRKNNGSK